MTTIDLSNSGIQHSATPQRVDDELLITGLLHSPIALGLLRRTGEVVVGNPALRALLGHGLMQGHTGLWQRIHSDDLAACGGAIADVCSGLLQHARVRARVSTSDHGDRWVDMRVTGIDDRARTAPLLFVCIVDVTDDMRLVADLEQHAHHDDLTGLLNRGAAMRALDDAIASKPTDGGRVAVVLCDLDHFKEINDRHGHAVGDAVIRTVADRLRGHVRTGDAVARLGGDEMLVLLADMTSMAQAVHIAEQLRAAVSEPMQLGDVCLRVSMSLGVVLIEDGVERDAAIARADAAMYRAKAAGRDAVVVLAGIDGAELDGAMSGNPHLDSGGFPTSGVGTAAC